MRAFKMNKFMQKVALELLPSFKKKKLSNAIDNNLILNICSNFSDVALLLVELN
jgi:hypothetical protein